MCVHKWERTGFSMSQGIVFADWECVECGEKDDTCLGELLNPDEV